MRLLIITICCSLLIAVNTVYPLADDKKAESSETPKQEIHDGSIPDHVIRYEDTLSPGWSCTWDLARQLYRGKKYREALVQYEILLAQKDNIDEARWEYASILLHLGRWQQAGEQLEKLLAGDPESKKYLFAMAKVSIETGYVEKAVKLFRQLYENASVVSDEVLALEGLVRSFELLGENEQLLPLIEQLADRNPDDRELQKKQAMLLIDRGYFDKAAAVLDKLENNTPVDASVIGMRAQLLGKEGDNDGAAVYWQKLIGLDSENMEAHRALQQYYAEKENWSMSLKHLEALLKDTPNNAELLEQAAELSVKIGRIDCALEYYDYSLALRPGNTQLLKKKKDAQRMLANDLLAIVENDGSNKLWQDLVHVTVDRPGIYKEIAELLRQKGQTDELIDVLTLLYHEDPQDEQTYRELTMLLEENGRSVELTDLRSNRQNMSAAGH